ncbi:14809_t:CDS:2 [Cetraspora pellucida]|uniref:14809_t:CDS:1 n=1 Tax=Cetraspora pellucida TaxID=1433469 RepID=A0A9N8W203_9GLOM|nr:14809_t:CDS:2 [Cetraspora pellucida]
MTDSFFTILLYTGNSYKLTKKKYPPSPPYFHGRLSNGPLWIDYFASKIDAKLNNYAFGGASCDATLVPSVIGPNNISVPGIAQQIDFFISNDMKKFDPADIVASIGKRMENLYCHGATNFIVASDTPADVSIPGQAVVFSPEFIQQINEKIELHNQYANAALEAFKVKHPDVNLYIVSITNILDTILAPESLEKLGITVVDIGCIPDDGFAGKNSVVCDVPEKYLFYDNYTALNTKVHEKMSEMILTYLE